jgi:hypothetical protein
LRRPLDGEHNQPLRSLSARIDRAAHRQALVTIGSAGFQAAGRSALTRNERVYTVLRVDKQHGHAHRERVRVFHSKPDRRALGETFVGLGIERLPDLIVGIVKLPQLNVELDVAITALLPGFPPERCSPIAP